MTEFIKIANLGYLPFTIGICQDQPDSIRQNIAIEIQQP